MNIKKKDIEKFILDYIPAEKWNHCNQELTANIISLLIFKNLININKIIQYKNNFKNLFDWRISIKYIT